MASLRNVKYVSQRKPRAAKGGVGCNVISSRSGTGMLCSVHSACKCTHAYFTCNLHCYLSEEAVCEDLSVVCVLIPPSKDSAVVSSIVGGVVLWRSHRRSMNWAEQTGWASRLQRASVGYMLLTLPRDIIFLPLDNSVLKIRQSETIWQHCSVSMVYRATNTTLPSWIRKNIRHRSIW